MYTQIGSCGLEFAKQYAAERQRAAARAYVGLHPRWRSWSPWRRVLVVAAAVLIVLGAGAVGVAAASAIPDPNAPRPPDGLAAAYATAHWGVKDRGTAGLVIRLVDLVWAVLLSLPVEPASLDPSTML